MQFYEPGPKNRITDVAGIRVGNAGLAAEKTGVTVLVPDEPLVCAVDVRGGGPGTRETDVLKASSTVQHVHALVLSGGSAFGLAAASAVQVRLAQHGKGFYTGTNAAGQEIRVPLVPQAILYDLTEGEKGWLDGRSKPPYYDLGTAAFDNLDREFDLGTAGAGTGATTADGAGGLGSASTRVEDRFTVGALVAVNAMGAVKAGATQHFQAAEFEIGKEFGGFGVAAETGAYQHKPRIKGLDRGVHAGTNTTIAIIATDLDLDRPALQRVGAMAHDGLARAIWPVHAPLDGDTVFVVSTGKQRLTDPLKDVLYAGQAAAQTLARAVARGVFEAERL